MKNTYGKLRSQKIIKQNYSYKIAVKYFGHPYKIFIKLLYPPSWCGRPVTSRISISAVPQLPNLNHTKKMYNRRMPLMKIMLSMVQNYSRIRNESKFNIESTNR